MNVHKSFIAHSHLSLSLRSGLVVVDLLVDEENGAGGLDFMKARLLCSCVSSKCWSMFDVTRKMLWHCQFTECLPFRGSSRRVGDAMPGPKPNPPLTHDLPGGSRVCV